MKAVGNTPLVCFDGVYAKLECTNPCGSIKDRIARFMLARARETGELAPGQRIVEATSGNTGIALAWCARELGHPVTIVMPENMTAERKQMVRDLGADLVLVSEEGSFAEAAATRDRLAAEHGWFNPDQFSNPLNAQCHELTTGEEIIGQMGGKKVDAFVAGVGTGGTIIGVGRRLRRDNPALHLVAVEPVESAVMSGGAPASHAIQGIGDGFIPELAGDGHGGIHPEIDEVVAVSSSDAIDEARRLAQTHGCCVGVSSGANFLVARSLLDRFPTVVTVFPDGYTKYRSLGLGPCASGRCPYEHELVVEP